jgi:hypothetical protein
MQVSKWKKKSTCQSRDEVFSFALNFRLFFNLVARAIDLALNFRLFFNLVARAIDFALNFRYFFNLVARGTTATLKIDQ